MLSKETLEFIEREGYKYTTRVQAQVTRMCSHHMTTLVTERGFKWIRDQARGNANEQLSPFVAVGDAHTERLLNRHGYEGVKVDQPGHFSEDDTDTMATSLHTLRAATLSTSSQAKSARLGDLRRQSTSQRLEVSPTCWAHLNRRMMEAHRAWRSIACSSLPATSFSGTRSQNSCTSPWARVDTFRSSGPSSLSHHRACHCIL